MCSPATPYLFSRLGAEEISTNPLPCLYGLSYPSNDVNSFEIDIIINLV